MKATPRSLALGITLLVLATVLFVVIDPALAWDDDNEWLGKGRLFLYFTTQSNILAVVAAVVHGLALVQGRRPSRGAEYLRGLAVVDLAITGIVNGVLLAEPGAPWDFSDFVLHQAAPVLVIVWWIIAPPAEPLPFSAVLLWLVHPLVWSASILMYAFESSDNWYPYFFLDPAAVDGWGGVVMFIAIIHVVIAVLGLATVGIGKLRRRTCTA